MSKTSRRHKSPTRYRSRIYREQADTVELISSFFRLRETDLHILAARDVTRQVAELATRFRLQVEGYAVAHPHFFSALAPLPPDPLAPPIIRAMLAAADQAGVGPMAAVAGAIADYVGQGLVDGGSDEVIVENGGDLFIHRNKTCTVGIFAASSPLSGKVGMKLAADLLPAGVCTSSATVGHSTSFGRADAVSVVAETAALADAFATRLGNEAKSIQNQKATEQVLTVARQFDAVKATVVICGESLGAAGSIELVPL